MLRFLKSSSLMYLTDPGPDPVMYFVALSFSKIVVILSAPDILSVTKLEESITSVSIFKTLIKFPIDY